MLPVSRDLRGERVREDVLVVLLIGATKSKGWK